MEKANLIKGGFYTVTAVTGGFIGNLVGGLDTLFVALTICVLIDYFSGISVALIFNNSPKTETGGAQSNVGLKGIVKKVFILLIVVVAVQIDKVINANGFIRNAVIVGFIANEGLSIVENAGLMGLSLPPALVNAIDILKKKSEEKQ